MKITKRQDNPTAAECWCAGVHFVAIFKTLHNTTNGHPRRQVFITWENPRNKADLFAQSYIIVLNFESEQEALQELAARIVKNWQTVGGR